MISTKCTPLMASPSLVLPSLAFPMACRSRRLTHYSFLFVSAAIPVVHSLLPELHQFPPKLTSLPHSPAPPEQPTSCCPTTYVCCQPMWSSLPYLKTREVDEASARPKQVTLFGNLANFLSLLCPTPLDIHTPPLTHHT